MIKTVLLVIPLLFLVVNANASEANSGVLWVWEENSRDHTFSIRLEEKNEKYIGSYCAVGMSGRKIDCSPKHGIKFEFTEKEPEFTFITNYSREEGRAKLIKTGKKWLWEIIENPDGEHYAPKKAFLLRYEKQL